MCQLIFILCTYYINYILVLAREIELRHLRKTVIDQEQEVSVLDKHIENMNNGIIKLEANTKLLEYEYTKCEQYLDKLRPKLLDVFSNITLPGKKLLFNYKQDFIKVLLKIFLLTSKSRLNI